ncbi:MAG: FHA domain-containing protein [Prevotella sp.]|nr:FHA domain-containing protein [Prevotella sp.]MCM1074154.1 FHA domain-containing protein [Ruminococcus sp.]
MSENIIKVKCPWCGAQLRIKEQANPQGKSITCPICKNKNPLVEFIQVEEIGVEEGTELPKFGLNRIGILRSTDGKCYRLNPGKNVVGRKAETSKADVRIDTHGNVHTSREHLIIDVERTSFGGYRHWVSLYKKEVNDTFVDGEKLTEYDKIELTDGNIIKLPDLSLTFELPDADKTRILS